MSSRGFRMSNQATAARRWRTAAIGALLCVSTVGPVGARASMVAAPAAAKGGGAAVASAAADFNGDRIADVAEALEGGGISVRFGLGDGRFADALRIAKSVRAT